jgi:hypothetical protein
MGQRRRFMGQRAAEGYHIGIVCVVLGAALQPRRHVTGKASGQWLIAAVVGCMAAGDLPACRHDAMQGVWSSGADAAGYMSRS